MPFSMIHDKKLLGVCGETSIANAKQSIITMMQVYEYFISHHLAKAFESLFGSVTCLPGCFTMYDPPPPPPLTCRCCDLPPIIALGTACAPQTPTSLCSLLSRLSMTILRTVSTRCT